MYCRRGGLQNGNAWKATARVLSNWRGQAISCLSRDPIFAGFLLPSYLKWLAVVKEEKDSKNQAKEARSVIVKCSAIASKVQSNKAAARRFARRGGVKRISGSYKADCS